VAIDEVGRRGGITVTHGGAHEPSPVDLFEARDPHQPGDPLAAAAGPGEPELGVDPGIP
jgi:hypothetical protein